MVLHLGDEIYEEAAGVYEAPSGLVRAARRTGGDDAGGRPAGATPVPRRRRPAGRARRSALADRRRRPRGRGRLGGLRPARGPPTRPAFCRGAGAGVPGLLGEHATARARSARAARTCSCTGGGGWGGLVTFHMLDTRQYRDDQVVRRRSDAPSAPIRLASCTGSRRSAGSRTGCAARAPAGTSWASRCSSPSSTSPRGPARGFNPRRVGRLSRLPRPRRRRLGRRRRRAATSWCSPGTCTRTGPRTSERRFDDPAVAGDRHGAGVVVDLVREATGRTGGRDTTSTPAENPHIRFHDDRRGFVRTRFEAGRDDQPSFKVVPYVSTTGRPASRPAPASSPRTAGRACSPPDRPGPSGVPVERARPEIDTHRGGTTCGVGSVPVVAELCLGATCSAGRPTGTRRSRCSTRSSRPAGRSSTPPTRTCGARRGNSGGESETIIGEWMAARGNRDEVGDRDEGRLAARARRACPRRTSRPPRRTRCAAWAPTGSTCTTPTATTRTPRRRRRSTRSTRWCGPGKVREVGASNFTAERLRSALEISERDGLAGVHRDPAALQPDGARRRTRPRSPRSPSRRGWPASPTTGWPRAS